MMRKGYLLILAALCSCSDKDFISLELQNESDLVLKEKPVVLYREQVGKYWREGLQPLVTDDGKDTLAAQLDDTDGDGQWDQLFFLADFQPGEKKKLTLFWTKDLPAFEKRTSVRFGVRDSLNDVVKPRVTDVFLPHELPGVNGYQPYQTDGPSWENDKVGFRHYLDGRNSKDVFGKKVSYMSPKNVGINAAGVTEDNYHVMEDWGRDILSVGTSLGVGGISFLIGDDRLRRLGIIEGDPKGNVDSTVFTIFSEGPVRSVIHFDYRNWRPLDENRAYNLQETVEIWPGFYGYKNTVKVAATGGDETLLVGLVNSRTDKPLKTIYENDQWIVLGTHDKQTYEKEWWLGLALVLPKEGYLGYIKAPDTGRIATSYLAKFTTDKPVSYYAMACWELRDAGFREEGYFENYLKNFTEQLSANIKIIVNP